MTNIVILLSTYNGTDFVEEQIQSIQAQSFRDWVLMVRDDGSQDETWHLVKQMSLKDKRIHLLPQQENIGVIASFSSLMKEGLQAFTNAQYFMFADQDDVWLDHKIQVTLEEMWQCEKHNDVVLVHTDLKVVDAYLNTISSSFMRFQHIFHKEEYLLHTLLGQNFVTGCTVMVNRNLLQVTLPVSKAALMHDWWLALCAASLGKVGFVEQATMLYRQHKENSVGAKGFWRVLKGALSSPKLFLMRRERFTKVQQQAQALMGLLQDKGIKQDVVESFVQLPYLSRLQRIRRVREAHIEPQFWIRKITFWWDLLNLAKQDKS